MPLQRNNLELKLRTSKLQAAGTSNYMLWATIGYLFLFIFRPFEYWEWLGEYQVERVYMIALLVAIALWPGKRYKNNSINWVLLAFFVVK